MVAEDTELVLEPNDLLVCIDETGSETLSDPRYPVFGIGGCAIRGDRYVSEIDQPWREIKSSYFAGPDKPLHANDIDRRNDSGILALGEFFQQRQFARFATVITSATKIDPPGTPPYLAAALAVLDQLRELIVRSTFYRFALVVESSHRGNPLVREHFSGFWPLLDTPDGPARAPIERCFMSKEACNPGLEVADFIMHAAGTQSYATLRKRTTFRKDFEVVFMPSPDWFSDFQLITNTLVTPKKPPGG